MSLGNNGRLVLYNGIDLTYGSAHLAYTPWALNKTMTVHGMLLTPVGSTYGTNPVLVVGANGLIYEYFEQYEPSEVSPRLSTPYGDLHEYLKAYVEESSNVNMFWVEYYKRNDQDRF